MDFNLHTHGDERAAALAHLPALRRSDVLICNRGYYSYALLCALRELSLSRR